MAPSQWSHSGAELAQVRRLRDFEDEPYFRGPWAYLRGSLGRLLVGLYLGGATLRLLLLWSHFGLAKPRVRLSKEIRIVSDHILQNTMQAPTSRNPKWTN